jgi:hypothetical protein
MMPADPDVRSSPGQAWIQAATTASVVLRAVIAAVVSYGHMHAWPCATARERGHRR